MIPVLEPPDLIWVCEHCTIRFKTHPSAMTPLHPCKGLHGMRVPLIREDSGHHLRLVEREDYIGGDDVRVDDEGRPVMRAEVEHAHGQVGVWVYAPCARIALKGM
jgi:hypothetical protein